MTARIEAFTQTQVDDFNVKIDALANMSTKAVVGDVLTEELTTVSKVKAFFLSIAKALGFNVQFNADPKAVVDALNEFLEKNFALLLVTDSDKLAKVQKVVSALQEEYSTHSYTVLEKEDGQNRETTTRVLGEKCLESSIEEVSFATLLRSDIKIIDQSMKSIIGMHPELQKSDFFQKTIPGATLLAHYDDAAFDRVKDKIKPYQN